MDVRGPWPALRAIRYARRVLMRAAALAVATWCALALCTARPADAQSLTLPTSAPGAVPQLLQEGIYATAPVVLDGTNLFRIAVKNAPASGATTIGSRVNDVQTNLGELIASVGPSASDPTVFDPKSLRIHVAHHGLVDALEAVDAHHRDPLPIVTVTVTDAQYNESTVDGLATQWQGVLQSALIRALGLRQPAAQRQGFERAARAGAALVVVSLLVFGLRSLFGRRIASLADAVAERERAVTTPTKTAAEGGDPHRQRRRFLAISLRAVKPEQQLRFYRAVAESLVWGLALVWFVAVTWGMSLFPETTPLAQQVTRGALGVLTTLVIFGLVNRLLDVVIARAAVAWRTSRFLGSEDNARQLLRIPTIAKALGGFKTFVLAFVAVLGILSQIGVPIGSVVTIGGVVAIALSLAAQNFVRDFLNGFLVLFEDHYVVGDYVTINTWSGLVERLTLRMVQIRDMSGDLITIPHSATTSVANQSRNWSRVDYRVPVDPASDVARAVELVRSTIEELARDDEWRDAVLDPVEWIGIDTLSKDWAIVRAVVKTAPLRQFAFRHAINARVLARFSEAQIALGAQIPGIA